MPQFDFSNYAAQVFWFSICFIVLYSFIAFVAIPRIKEVVANRSSVIGEAVGRLEELNSQISSLSEKSNSVVKDADVKYRSMIAKAVQESKEVKEGLFDKFREDSENLLAKSKSEVDSLISESRSKSQKAAAEIAAIIEGKILN